MADLIDRAALLEKKTTLWDDSLGWTECVDIDDIEAAPAVDAVDCNTLRRIIYSETARLYRADEEMIKAMGGYNPSSFLAGYKYAIDCITSKLSLLAGERKET